MFDTFDILCKQFREALSRGDLGALYQVEAMLREWRDDFACQLDLAGHAVRRRGGSALQSGGAAATWL